MSGRVCERKLKEIKTDIVSSSPYLIHIGVSSFIVTLILRPLGTVLPTRYLIVDIVVVAVVIVVRIVIIIPTIISIIIAHPSIHATIIIKNIMGNTRTTDAPGGQTLIEQLD